MASEGKNVIYECKTHDMARWTFDKAARIVTDFMEFEAPEPLLLKIGTGYVRFVPRLKDNETHMLENSDRYELITDA